MTVLGDIELVSRAADYACGAADTVSAELLSRPTPCSRWNLQMLLRHTCESVAALHEGLTTGRVALFPPSGNQQPSDLTCLLRERLSMLVEQWSVTDGGRAVTVAGQDITVPVMAGVAALEIAVHGWDIAQTGGDERSIPADLARELLCIAAELLSDDNRHPLFAPAIPAAETTCPGDELLAFLGRRPGPVGALEVRK